MGLGLRKVCSINEVSLPPSAAAATRTGAGAAVVVDVPDRTGTGSVLCDRTSTGSVLQ